MKKITIEVEFEKYGSFGRTSSKADMDVYEDSGFLTEETIERVMKYVNKLFANKNLFNPCVTFIYRDIDTESIHERHYTSRIFGMGCGCDLNKVVWHKNSRDESTIKKVTKKVIEELYFDCVTRATKGEKAIA